ncbi:MAG: methylenetetrahydrofolate reductase [NAD(P)H] [Clostridiaceae bacterium]|jgi:methylenetetrahydrofolate reductase (NADPH)|nr:methylenetetrahydrofolate reductase [NAD(P)H] [Clostridiaceae bacterium]
MKLKDIYINSNKPVISYEVFPPKETDKIDNLLEELSILNKFNPAFVSLTCSAGGSGENNTEATLEILNKKCSTQIMPHLTCICNTKENILNKINTYKNMGIENILALRGDIPENISLCAQDFRYANDLTQFLKQHTDFSIAVAGYPEGHIESPDIDTDIVHLKQKVQSGADAIFTQLFFSNDKLYSYIDKLKNKGISIPIIPGIMPIISYKQIQRMTKLAKITIPQKLQSDIEKYKDDSVSMKEMGIEFATKQCIDLVNNGIKGLHFFTLDKSYSTAKILNNI